MTNKIKRLISIPIGHGFISPDHSASICNWK